MRTELRSSVTHSDLQQTVLTESLLLTPICNRLSSLLLTPIVLIFFK